MTAGGGTLQADSSAPYTVSNAVNLSSTLTVVNGNSLTLTGSMTGSGGLTKNGAGTLTLSGPGAKTYSGNTTVNDGTLVVSTVSAGMAEVIVGNLTIGDGVGAAGSALVTFVHPAQVTQPGPSTVTINSDGVLNLRAGGSNPSAKLGPMVMSGGAINTVGAPGQVICGFIGNVTTLASNTTATISGVTGVLSATSQTNTFTIAKGTTANGIDLDVPAFLVGLSGSSALVKAGPGTMRLSASNSFGGGTTVQGGVFQLGANAAAGTGPLTVASGTFDLNGFNQSVPSLTFGDGSATTAAIVSGAGTLTVNGDITFHGAPQFVTPQATLASNVSLPAGNHTIAVAGAHSGGAYSVVISGTIGGNGGLTVAAGQGIGFNVALTGQNTYAGPTVVAADAFHATGLYLGATNALPPQTAVTVGAGGTLGLSPPPSGQGGVTPGNYSQLIGSLSGAGLVELGSATLTVGNDNTSTEFSGSIVGNGGALVKTGSGTLNLTGPGNILGGVRVAAGALVFNIASGTPTVASGVTVTVNSGAVLELVGPVSALGSTGGHRAHIVNDSVSGSVPGEEGLTGLVVIFAGAGGQVVGGIDGAGATQVYTGSHLTADHIIQSALVIGDAMPGGGTVVTISASDSSGNPLDIARGGPLGQSGAGDAGTVAGLVSSGAFGIGASNSAGSLPLGAEGLSGDPIPASPPDGVANPGGNSAAVPEPSAAVLLGIASLIWSIIGFRRRTSRLGAL